MIKKVYKVIDIIQKHYNGGNGEKFERLIENVFRNSSIDDFYYEIWETFENPAITIKALAISWIENGKLQCVVDTITLD